MPGFHYMALPANSTEFADNSDIKNVVLINPSSPMFITTQNRPLANTWFSDVPDSKWCKIVRPTTSTNTRTYSSDAITNGRLMAEDIVNYLNGSRGYAPGFVMIDELRYAPSGGIDTRLDIQACGNWMNGTFGAGNPANTTLYGKWGCFLYAAEGMDFRNAEPAIRSIMEPRAVICPTFYPTRAVYASKGTTAAADAWLYAMMHTGTGSAVGGRYNWLWNLASSVPGNGPVPFSAIIGVTDTMTNGGSSPNYTKAKYFIDRAIWQFRQTGPGQGTSAFGNGGIGTYKFDPATIADSTRDTSFKDSWYHYVYSGNTTLRPGVGAALP